MARKKKRRTKTGHEGVKLLPRVYPSGTEVWRARWRDPGTGKVTEYTFNPKAHPTHRARRQWAIKKAKALAKRRAEIIGGAPATSTPIVDAVKSYLETCRANRLRDRTLEVYSQAADKLVKWANKNGVQTVEALTPARITAFRDSRAAQRRQAVAAGGRRGGRKASSAVRSPLTVNVELRAVKTMLLQWRSEERLPNADKEAISRALKLLPAPQEAPAYLPPAKCRKLLEAALRHDNAMFQETREEHAGLKPVGTTPRYQPIAPFVAYLLLTGCRVGEAESLTWSAVDLDALDNKGRKVGEITLQATATKTKRYRTIGLEVCPSLRTMLAAMKLQAGSTPYVFGGKTPLPHSQVEAVRKRLVRSYGAPRFSWQNLRQTTGTFLTNAPGIYGAASVFLSARQLGHSVAVAEKHYLGVIRGIPREASTLEQAMQIEEVMRQVVERVRSPHPTAALSTKGKAGLTRHNGSY